MRCRKSPESFPHDMALRTPQHAVVSEGFKGRRYGSVLLTPGLQAESPRGRHDRPAPNKQRAGLLPQGSELWGRRILSSVGLPSTHGEDASQGADSGLRERPQDPTGASREKKIYHGQNSTDRTSPPHASALNSAANSQRSAPASFRIFTGRTPLVPVVFKLAPTYYVILRTHTMPA